MPDETARPDVAVVVPAAGEGRRMGGRRKQFRQLGGRPLLEQTLWLFERHPEVDHLYVAAPAEACDPLAHALHDSGIRKLASVVAGGATRQASVAAALQALPPSVGVVLVHDAVRPFVRPDEVTAVIRAVAENGAAALAIPVTDTLRRGVGALLGETVPRDGLYRMQTPQGFRRDRLLAAHERARADGYLATDDVDLVQRLGDPVSLVQGGSHNVKITTAEDWAWARHFWSLWEAALTR